MTNADRIRSATDEELAEMLAVQETALCDLVFSRTQKEIKKQTGRVIDFNAHFRPDFMKQKAWWFDWLRKEEDRDG